MRGGDAMQESLFTVAKLDDFVPADHPLRAIRVLANDALTAMNSLCSANSAAVVHFALLSSSDYAFALTVAREYSWCKPPNTDFAMTSAFAAKQ
jgi:hypothetical protein